MPTLDPNAVPSPAAGPRSAADAQIPAPLADRLRHIPSVAAIVALAREGGSTLTDHALTRAARGELEIIRRALIAGEQFALREIKTRTLNAILSLDRPRLQPIINATGVIIHTNLGRAPVSEETAAAMQAAAAHPVALEIDPETNERGGRMREIGGLMRALTGAEATLVVNNCASAVLLTLAAVASGKGVVVSRGEAVEIGGGFRIPDVLRQSGARLIEVGTTNRTYVRDYAAATDDETAAYLKVHPSNFRAFGFVHAASTRELSVLARERGVALLEDLGSGALLDTARFGLASEPMVGDAIAAGADLVMASGDKLLGGPQAGIIAGSGVWVERVARHPLARAVRADKTALAGIAATLRHYARGEAETHIPVWQMVAAPPDTLHDRAESIARKLRPLGIEVVTEAVLATVGGGSLPGETLPSWALVLHSPRGEGIDHLARRLRLADPAIFGRIDRHRLLLDLRTVPPSHDEILTAAIQRAVSPSPIAI